MGRPKRKERPLILIQAGDDTERDFWCGFVEVARKYDWRLYNSTSSSGGVPEDMKPVGAVLNCLPNDPLVKRLTAQGCHCIRRGNFRHRDETLPVVFHDRESAGRMAAEHFAARGFKHVGQVVSVPIARPDGMYESFIGRARELGMETHVLERDQEKHLTVGLPSPEEHLSEWLPTVPKPFGFFAYHYFMATNAYRVACQAGLSVPQEIGILSMGDSFHCELNPVPISAIEEDMVGAGRDTANFLKCALDGEPNPDYLKVPPKRVVLRQSTDVLAVPDMVVAKALSFIWEYYHWPLTVDDIALEAQVSRSTLERRFQRHLGRAVNAELQRKRLDRCAELLRTTTMSVTELAKVCGFQHRGYLHRLFQKAYGMTPVQYRSTALTDDPN